MYAMWSQVDIVKSHIRDGNEADADEAFDRLVTLFAEQPSLPKEIYQVGDEYAEALNYDKAELLYQYVIANWPGSEYEMWAGTGIIKLDICLGNDANVQPALDNKNCQVYRENIVKLQDPEKTKNLNKRLKTPIISP